MNQNFWFWMININISSLWSSEKYQKIVRWLKIENIWQHTEWRGLKYLNFSFSPPNLRSNFLTKIVLGSGTLSYCAAISNAVSLWAITFALFFRTSSLNAPQFPIWSDSIQFVKKAEEVHDQAFWLWNIESFGKFENELTMKKILHYGTVIGSCFGTCLDASVSKSKPIILDFVSL